MKIDKIVLSVIGIVCLLTAALFMTQYFKAPTEDLSLESVRAANERAIAWIKNNLKDDGLFVYRHDPVKHEYSSSNNAIRQLMTARALAEVSHNDNEALSLHRQNLVSLLRQWYREDDDIGYVYFNNKSKLGAIAMLLRTLIYSPDYEVHTEVAEALYQGILSLQEPDGSFKPWYIEPSYEYNEDYILTFYSGEALLAMVEYYERTKDPAVLAAATSSAEFYVGHYVDQIELNYYPAYVPWHTLAYNKLYQITKDRRYAEAIFIMNDKLIDEMLDRFPPFTGRFYNPDYHHYGTPHSSSDGVYTEGVAYALEIAELVDDTEHINKYREALSLAVPHLIGMQYKKPNETFKAPPESYLGSLKISHDNPDTRNDTTQHASDALTKVLEVW